MRLESIWDYICICGLKDCHEIMKANLRDKWQDKHIWRIPHHCWTVEITQERLKIEVGWTLLWVHNQNALRTAVTQCKTTWRPKLRWEILHFSSSHKNSSWVHLFVLNNFAKYFLSDYSFESGPCSPRIPGLESQLKRGKFGDEQRVNRQPKVKRTLIERPPKEAI